MLYFGMLLAVFHVLQVIAYNIFGRKAQQQVVFILNGLIVFGWYITGTKASFNMRVELP